MWTNNCSFDCSFWLVCFPDSVDIVTIVENIAYAYPLPQDSCDLCSFVSLQIIRIL